MNIWLSFIATKTKIYSYLLTVKKPGKKSNFYFFVVFRLLIKSKTKQWKILSFEQFIHINISIIKKKKFNGGVDAPFLRRQRMCPRWDFSRWTFCTAKRDGQDGELMVRDRSAGDRQPFRRPPYVDIEKYEGSHCSLLGYNYSFLTF